MEKIDYILGVDFNNGKDYSAWCLLDKEQNIIDMGKFDWREITLSELNDNTLTFLSQMKEKYPNLKIVQEVY